MSTMDEFDLEIHNNLPHYDAHSGELRRMFGSYQGDLVLVTEFAPPSSLDIGALAANMTAVNRSVEDDFIFDYCGTFVCPHESEDDRSIMKSLVMYPEGGLLSGLIFSDIKLGWSFRIQIAVNIARALCHLHNNNIIHNDINPQAFALNSEWTCKLLDMFYAVRVEDIFSQHSVGETELRNRSAHAAPELHAEGKCVAASDIYSFGICLFEICSRVLVTSIHKNHDLYRESAADVVLDHLPESCPDSLRELIRQMLSLEADLRPTIEDVLDWLESLLTETCLEDDPPLPPLPKLPFPDRRKSGRLSRGSSFNSSPVRKSTSRHLELPSVAEVSISSDTDGSADRRAGRGGGYAISKTDADRLKSLAQSKRESDARKTGGDSAAGRSPSSTDVHQHQGQHQGQSHSSESFALGGSNLMIGVASEADPPTLEGYLSLKADNLPFYKSKFFYFKDNSLAWCSDIKLRDQAERLHYFDLSTARVVDSSHLGIHVEVDPALISSDPLPGQPRKKLFRSSRARERLIIKFQSEEQAATWKAVLDQEIHIDRCKMCRVKLEPNAQRSAHPETQANDCFCSPMCVNYYVATTARGMMLSGKSLQYSNALRLSQADIKALDKKLIERRNPKTWKRILQKQEGADLSHGVANKGLVGAAEPLPQSIEEWLTSLHLESLVRSFNDAGYGCIGHIIMAGLYEEDMTHLKIVDKKVRLQLMKQAKALGETYVNNRNYFNSRDEMMVA